MSSDRKKLILGYSRIKLPINLISLSTCYSNLDKLGRNYQTKDFREYNKLVYPIIKFITVEVIMPNNLKELCLRNCDLF